MSELDKARATLAEIKAEAIAVIRVMTAEQALKAQRVMREAGKKKWI